MKALGSLAVVFCMMWPLGAQVAAPPQPNPNTTPAPPAQMRPPAPANLGPLLMQLEQAAQSTNLNLARLRIEKWKADGDYKRQSQDNANSLQRNISAATTWFTAATTWSPRIQF